MPTNAPSAESSAPAFTLAGLRVEVARRAGHPGDPATAPLLAPTKVPLLDEAPDPWLVWTWGMATRLLGDLEDPRVARATAAARAAGDIGAAVAVLAEADHHQPSDEQLRRDFVIGLFLCTLGRLPTAGDLAHHVELLRTGMPHAAMLTELVNTDESRRALRHPRPWQTHRVEAPAEPASALARLKRAAPRSSDAEALADVRARLDALAEQQWATFRLLAESTGHDATRAVHAPADPDDAAATDEPDDGIGGRELRGVGRALDAVAACGIVRRAVREIRLAAPTDADGPLLASVVVDVLPPGARRLGEAATALAALGWSLSEAAAPAPAGFEVRSRLTLRADLPA